MGFIIRYILNGYANSYGLYTKNQIQSTYSGTGYIYGIYADIEGGDNHTGNTYGLRLINDGTTTGLQLYSTGEDLKILVEK